MASQPASVTGVSRRALRNPMPRETRRLRDAASIVRRAVTPLPFTACVTVAMRSMGVVLASVLSEINSARLWRRTDRHSWWQVYQGCKVMAVSGLAVAHWFR